MLTGAFACSAWMRAANRELPERIGRSCLALMTVATHKAARLLAKDRVTSTVRAPFTRFEGVAGQGEGSAAARGRRVRRAVGEPIVCPCCLGLWAAAFFAAGFAVAPRPHALDRVGAHRHLGSDVLDIAYKNAENSM